MHFVQKLPTPPITEISFKVSRPDGHYGLHKIVDTVFALGLGPCGRHVTRLDCVVTDGVMKIAQTSYATAEPDPEGTEEKALRAMRDHYRPRWFGLVGDHDAWVARDHALQDLYERHKAWRETKEIKEFVYKIADVHGRIVTTS